MDKANRVSLEIAWGVYFSLVVVGNELRLEGDGLQKSGDEACNEADTLREKARKLREEGDQIIAVSDKRWTEADELESKFEKLRVEGYRYRSIGHALQAVGRKVETKAENHWAESVKKAYGDMNYVWNVENGKRSCTLENGERFVE